MRRRLERDGSARAAVTLRRAAHDDCADVWRWRNEEESRRASFDPSPIPYDAHRAWFARSLARPDRLMYIVCAEGRPCGVARLDLARPAATVSIFLTRARHGEGIGPAALRALAERARSEHGLKRLVALVKPDNRASLAAFARAGFTRSAAVDGAVTLVKRLGQEGVGCASR